MQNKETLHLNLHKHWFDMVVSGNKKVEYRDLTDYWVKRLLKEGSDGRNALLDTDFKYRNGVAIALIGRELTPKYDFKTVTFRNGYWANADEAVFELEAIKIASPVKEWFPSEPLLSMGIDFNQWASNHPLFAIKLGKLLRLGKMNGEDILLRHK